MLDFGDVTHTHIQTYSDTFTFITLYNGKCDTIISDYFIIIVLKRDMLVINRSDLKKKTLNQFKF